MSRLLQKVSGGIHSQNQNHQRPNRFCRGYPSPPPGVLQTFRNRVRVARVARVRMVCRVRYERVLARLLWASSGITARGPSCAWCCMRCVWDSISNADGIAGGNALPHARVCPCVGARGSRHPFSVWNSVTFRSRAAARGVGCEV